MAAKDSSIVSVMKATLVGGAVCLIPAFLVFFVLGKVLNVLRSLALAIGPKLGIVDVLGGVVLDLAAIALVLVICLLAGLVARWATAQKLRTKIDQALLGSMPGYALVKGVAENIHRTEESASGFVPVLVKFDDYWQVAFETDRMAEGIVAVYLPGAPNPWSGSVVFVAAERVRKLPVPVTEAIKITRSLGRGSEALAAELRAISEAERCS
jgi:uncharacterized membrane protein